MKSLGYWLRKKKFNLPVKFECIVTLNLRFKLFQTNAPLQVIPGLVVFKQVNLQLQLWLDVKKENAVRELIRSLTLHLNDKFNNSSNDLNSLIISSLSKDDENYHPSNVRQLFMDLLHYFIDVGKVSRWKMRSKDCVSCLVGCMLLEQVANSRAMLSLFQFKQIVQEHD